MQVQERYETPFQGLTLEQFLDQPQIEGSPAFKFLGQNPGDFPVAEYLCDRIVSLPIYPGIQPQQVDYVCEMVRMGVESYSTTKLSV